MDKIWNVINRIVKFFMGVILRIFRIKWNENQWNSFLQFVGFCIVGVSNTLLSYVINVLVLLSLSFAKVSWDYFAANIVAFILSVLWSFYWNNRFVFAKKDGEKRSWWKALLKTYVCYSVSGLILANVLSWLWVDLLGVSKYVAPFINLIISVPLNFILNKLWAFKSDSPKDEIA